MASVATRPSARKPRIKPARSIRLVCRSEAGLPGLIRLAVGKESHPYTLRRIPSDFGIGFELCKLVADPAEARTYHINLDPADLTSTGKHTCECLGHLHWNPKRGTVCKHVAGILALLSRQPAA